MGFNKKEHSLFMEILALQKGVELAYQHHFQPILIETDSTECRWETTLRILTLFKPHLTQIYKNCCCVHVGQGIGEVFEEFDQYSFH
ncbi:uncharacterized protein LOC107009545 isoform X2 [Solanum pennellii]|uniref:Uncharacterized protein LOC107009545 isoform X2 n=1 Tax=Solanum pennellii TaxID=28526 RepID=A0ABM1V339_SOLPN|nr:uncharacterized protein LOC107009545 isoform X2 [Solanum pennellii]